MSAAGPVIALGHTWADLELEQEVLGKFGAEVVDGRNLAEHDPVWRRVRGVLLGTAQKLGARELARMPQCKGVVRYGIGYDNVDIEAARERGVTVAIVRDYCIDEVAEHALAFALSLARSLAHWDRAVRSGQWRKGPKIRLHRLGALKLGIVGFGLIGQALARKATGIFGEIYAHDPFAKPAEEVGEDGITFVDRLDELLASADIVSLHVPLTEDTRCLIDARKIGTMKRGASLINVSRGGIVDEDALIEAVRSGHLAGAGLDTFVGEPLGAGNAFADEPNILVSPHVAWLSEEAEESLRTQAAEEMVRILSGATPRAAV